MDKAKQDLLDALETAIKEATKSHNTYFKQLCANERERYDIIELLEEHKALLDSIVATRKGLVKKYYA